MKIALKNLKPNPFRNFDLYPIFPEWINQLKDSINQTGYWNGFCVREFKGEYQLAYGHHRLEAAKRVYGEDYEIEVELEEMTDYMMRARMFRENVRNDVQDSAVILHDIEVAKKFPSDWESAPIGAGKRDKHHPTLSKLSNFIGRDLRTVERVYYSLKTEKKDGLTPNEMNRIAPGTSEVLAKEIRIQKPSPEARKQIIREAKEGNIGPKTAKERVQEIILDEKVPLSRKKETPNVYMFMGDLERQNNLLRQKLHSIALEIENINWENLITISFVRSLDRLNDEIQTIRRAFYEAKEN